MLIAFGDGVARDRRGGGLLASDPSKVPDQRCCTNKTRPNHHFKMHKVKTILSRLACASALAVLAAISATSATAADIKPAPTPTLEQRVAGLEAYLTNGDPTAPLKVGDKIPDGLTTPSVGVPGPGHNGWMMTSSALVLFMTLPGLALFYGGLVRRKNVLSVLAQCL